MFSPFAVFAAIIVYSIGLFIIAQWSERSQTGKKLAASPIVYALGLAVYCTTWTYYGSVGKASKGGMGFLPVYLGPTLGLLLGSSIFRRMARLKHAHRITSIADFVSSRYGKSEGIAALVTVILTIGIVPYVGLQLKAITDTFNIMTVSADGSLSSWSGFISPMIAVIMTVFTIMFGIRHLDPTERHPGMVSTLAAESILKLVAFVAAGVFIVGAAFGDFGGFLKHFAENPPELPMMKEGDHKTVISWITVTLLSMSAFSFLPRQFHVGIVENGDPDHVKKAAWLTPLYLFAINLFVVPIAIAGAKIAAAGTTGDQFVLAVPIQQGATALSLGVFIGGFSAAIGMIVIEGMAISTMIANHLILPVIQRFSALAGLRRQMLYIRWLAAGAFIFAGYGFEVAVGNSYMLVAIGLVSFAAAFIVAPVLLSGLFSSQASRGGAYLGLSAGFIMWAFTLLMPTFIKSGWMPMSILSDGVFGLSWLRPEALFGFDDLPALTHGVLWSGGATVVGLGLGTVLWPSVGEERALTDAFLNEGDSGFAHLDNSNRTISKAEKQALTESILAPYFSEAEVAEMVQTCFAEAGVLEHDMLTVVEDAELHNIVEKHLAGAIGAASAHNAMRAWGEIDRKDQKALMREFAKMLARLKLSPKELKAKVDFQAERESLLKEQFQALQTKIDERDAEIVEREKAEVALQAAHDELEERVRARTAELDDRNTAMRLVLDNVAQGFGMLDMDGVLGGERSAAMNTWLELEDGPVGLVDALDKVSPEFAQWMAVSWESVTDGFLPVALTLAQCPRRLSLPERTLEFAYEPIFDGAPEDENLTGVLLVVTDISAELERMAAEERQKEVLNLFDRIMKDKVGFLEFFAEADRLVERVAHNELDAAEIDVLKREIHTLKGNAGIFGVTSIARICHELEEDIEERGALPSDALLGDLRKAWQGTKSRIQDMVGEGLEQQIQVDDADYEQILHAVVERKPLVEIEAQLRSWQLEPTRRVFGRLKDQVKRLAERLGKSGISVEIRDAGVRLPSEDWAPFWSSLVHVVRNSVDHGFDEDDTAKRIRFSARRDDDGDLLIEVSDNGRGIDWARVKEMAIRKDLPARTEADLKAALFADGVSTRENVTAISGRGVGMAAVLAETTERGGSIDIESLRGQGTTFRFQFPREATILRADGTIPKFAER